VVISGVSYLELIVVPLRVADGDEEKSSLGHKLMGQRSVEPLLLEI